MCPVYSDKYNIAFSEKSIIASHTKPEILGNTYIVSPDDFAPGLTESRTRQSISSHGNDCSTVQDRQIIVLCLDDFNYRHVHPFLIKDTAHVTKLLEVRLHQPSYVEFPVCTHGVSYNHLITP